jgi:hypothetical protein
MILTNDQKIGQRNNVGQDTDASHTAIGGYPRERVYLILFCAAVVVFAGVASRMGLPGADTNARDTYNVITRLTRTLTYTLSRTPGQPFLDYCNYVFRSLGGDFAVQAWFVLVSAAGVTALYCMVRELGGVAPTLAALTLALNPLFLTHVGGVGDFAVSNSFLLISLLFASRYRSITAGVFLAMAVGCRLVYCLYVIPVAVLVALAARASGASVREEIESGKITAVVAALLSAVEYGPSFCFWGRDLLKNLPFQGLKYHTTAFLFKLLIALGGFIWLLLGGLCVSLFRRARKSSTLCVHPGAVLVATLMIVCCTAYFFRVPTKPELTLPILIGITIIVQFCASSRWATALMIGSVVVGFVVVSPYDRSRDTYEWHFEKGWYSQNYQEAYQNRFQLQIMRSLLSTLPNQAIVITRPRWTIEQGGHFDLESVNSIAGVELETASAFRGLGVERVIVDPQDGNLRRLLETVTKAASPDHRVAVVYERSYLGLLRRWSHLDLAQYGRPLVLP